MISTFIIGLLVFIPSFLLSIAIVLSSFLRNIAVSSFGIVHKLLFITFPVFCIVMELAIYNVASYAFGAAYIFIVMNLLFLIMQSVSFAGSAIFFKSSIFVLGHCLKWKVYSYKDVIGYTMKKTSGKIYSRLGSKTAITFDVNIYFSDNKYATFSVGDQFDKKVQHIKLLLEEHKCHKNGRINRKSK